MANGESGGSLLDLSDLPQQKKYGGLSGPEWATSILAALSPLGVGRPGARIFPFGSGALLADAYQKGFERSYQGALGKKIGDALPESSPMRSLIGPLMQSGQINAGDALKLWSAVLGQQRKSRAASAYAGLPSWAPSQDVEVSPSQTFGDLEGTSVDPAVTERFPGRVTQSDLRTSIAALPEDIRDDVLTMALPEIRRAPEPPVDLEKVQTFRALVENFTRQGASREDAIASARRVVFGGESSGAVEKAAAEGRDRDTIAEELERQGQAGLAAQVRRGSPAALQRGIDLVYPKASSAGVHVREVTDKDGNVTQIITRTDPGTGKTSTEEVPLKAKGKPMRAARETQPTESTTTRTKPRSQIKDADEMTRLNGALPDVVNSLSAKVPGFTKAGTGTVDVPGVGAVPKTKLIERAYLKQFGIEVAVRWDGRAFRIVQAWEPEQVLESTTRKGPARSQADDEREADEVEGAQK